MSYIYNYYFRSNAPIGADIQPFSQKEEAPLPAETIESETAIVEQMPLADLPHELLLMIFARLGSVKDVRSLGSTCKDLRWVSGDDNIWRPFLERYFPRITPGADSSARELFLAEVNLHERFRSNVKKRMCFMYALCNFEELGWKVSSLRYDNNNKLLYAGYSNGRIQIWDLETRIAVCLRTLEGPGESTVCSLLRINKDLVAGFSDGTVKIWDIETGDELATIKKHTAPVAHLMHDDDLLLLSFSDGMTKVWDLVRGECVSTEKGQQGKELASLLRIDSKLILGFADGKIILTDLKKNLTQVFKAHHNAVRHLVPGVEGTFISGSRREGVKVWNLETGNHVDTLTHRCHNNFCALTQTDGILYALNNGGVCIWDLEASDPSSSHKNMRNEDALSTRFPGVLASGDGKVFIGSVAEPDILVMDHVRSHPSSYSLPLLEENLEILENMADLDRQQKHDDVRSLAEKLHPDFKLRLEQLCSHNNNAGLGFFVGALKNLIGRSPSSLGIVHLKVAVHLELLLHAIDKHDTKLLVRSLNELCVLHLTSKWMRKLYELMGKRFGKDLDWASDAFFANHEKKDSLYQPNMYAKLQVVQRAKEMLLAEVLIDRK